MFKVFLTPYFGISTEILQFKALQIQKVVVQIVLNQNFQIQILGNIRKIYWKNNVSHPYYVTINLLNLFPKYFIIALISLKGTKASMKLEIRIIGSYLGKQLINRDKLLRKRQVFFNLITAGLQAFSDKTRKYIFISLFNCLTDFSQI